MAPRLYVSPVGLVQEGANPGLSAPGTPRRGGSGSGSFSGVGSASPGSRRHMPSFYGASVATSRAKTPRKVRLAFPGPYGSRAAWHGGGALRANPPAGYTREGVPFFVPTNGELPMPTGYTKFGVAYYAAADVVSFPTFRRVAARAIMRHPVREDVQRFVCAHRPAMVRFKRRHKPPPHRTSPSRQRSKVDLHSQQRHVVKVNTNVPRHGTDISQVFTDTPASRVSHSSSHAAVHVSSPLRSAPQSAAATPRSQQRPQHEDDTHTPQEPDDAVGAGSTEQAGGKELRRARSAKEDNFRTPTRVSEPASVVDSAPLEAPPTAAQAAGPLEHSALDSAFHSLGPSSITPDATALATPSAIGLDVGGTGGVDSTAGDIDSTVALATTLHSDEFVDGVDHHPAVRPVSPVHPPEANLTSTAASSAPTTLQPGVDPSSADAVPAKALAVDPPSEAPPTPPTEAAASASRGPRPTVVARVPSLDGVLAGIDFLPVSPSAGSAASYDTEASAFTISSDEDDDAMRLVTTQYSPTLSGGPTSEEGEHSTAVSPTLSMYSRRGPVSRRPSAADIRGATPFHMLTRWTSSHAGAGGAFGASTTTSAASSPRAFGGGASPTLRTMHPPPPALAEEPDPESHSEHVHVTTYSTSAPAAPEVDTGHTTGTNTAQPAPRKPNAWILGRAAERKEDSTATGQHSHADRLEASGAPPQSGAVQTRPPRAPAGSKKPAHAQSWRTGIWETDSEQEGSPGSAHDRGVMFSGDNFGSTSFSDKALGTPRLASASSPATRGSTSARPPSLALSLSQSQVVGPAGAGAHARAAVGGLVAAPPTTPGRGGGGGGGSQVAPSPRTTRLRHPSAAPVVRAPDAKEGSAAEAASPQDKAVDGTTGTAAENRLVRGSDANSVRFGLSRSVMEFGPCSQVSSSALELRLDVLPSAPPSLMSRSKKAVLQQILSVVRAGKPVELLLTAKPAGVFTASPSSVRIWARPARKPHSQSHFTGLIRPSGSAAALDVTNVEPWLLAQVKRSVQVSFNPMAAPPSSDVSGTLEVRFVPSTLASLGFRSPSSADVTGGRDTPNSAGDSDDDSDASSASGTDTDEAVASTKDAASVAALATAHLRGFAGPCVLASMVVSNDRHGSDAAATASGGDALTAAGSSLSPSTVRPLGEVWVNPAHEFVTWLQLRNASSVPVRVELSVLSLATLSGRHSHNTTPTAASTWTAPTTAAVLQGTRSVMHHEPPFSLDATCVQLGGGETSYQRVVFRAPRLQPTSYAALILVSVLGVEEHRVPVSVRCGAPVVLRAVTQVDRDNAARIPAAADILRLDDGFDEFFGTHGAEGAPRQSRNTTSDRTGAASLWTAKGVASVHEPGVSAVVVPLPNLSYRPVEPALAGASRSPTSRRDSTGDGVDLSMLVRSPVSVRGRVSRAQSTTVRQHHMQRQQEVALPEPIQVRCCTWEPTTAQNLVCVVCLCICVSVYLCVCGPSSRTVRLPWRK